MAGLNLALELPELLDEYQLQLKLEILEQMRMEDWPLLTDQQKHWDLGMKI